MSLFLDDGDVRLYHGDALETLRQLPDGCVDMVATSPPFYGLRDYGTGEWEGGDECCDHQKIAPPKPAERYSPGGPYVFDREGQKYGTECGKCGARRVDRQIGLEETPDQWVASLVAVFRECRRVLADHGTLWVEIGDSYAGGKAGRTDTDRIGQSLSEDEPVTSAASKYAGDLLERRDNPPPPGTKPKDLLGQPWLLAFALRADGWYLRSEIIWARPNPMPESVTDRPTKSHSTIFLLSKRPKYFYDADAIREEYAAKTLTHRGNGNAGGKAGQQDATGKVASGNWGDWGAARTAHPRPTPQSETLDGSDGESPRGPDGRRVTAVKGAENSEQHRDGERWPNPSGANARSVWNIPTQPTPFAHFATWPQKLVARMIQAGTSEHGKCPECGKPWMRDVEHESSVSDATRAELIAKAEARGLNRHRASGASFYSHRTTLGWSPSCACTDDMQVHEPFAPAPTAVPCTVLDPFAGSGTTLLVARNHGRHAIGIELNPDYCQIAATQLQQLSLLT